MWPWRRLGMSLNKQQEHKKVRVTKKQWAFIIIGVAILWFVSIGTALNYNKFSPAVSTSENYPQTPESVNDTDTSNKLNTDYKNNLNSTPHTSSPAYTAPKQPSTIQVCNQTELSRLTANYNTSVAAENARHNSKLAELQSALNESPDYLRGSWQGLIDEENHSHKMNLSQLALTLDMNKTKINCY